MQKPNALAVCTFWDLKNSEFIKMELTKNQKIIWDTRPPPCQRRGVPEKVNEGIVYFPCKFA